MNLIEFWCLPFWRAEDLQLASAKPMAAGNQLLVKTGARPSARLGGCTGEVVTGAGVEECLKESLRLLS